jgi:hypothetical protein
MRNRMNVYLPPELLEQVTELASRKKLSQSAVIAAAILSFMSPDGTDRREAAFTRRLDKLTRQIARLERNTGVTMEMLALFVRFLLTITPPLPPEAQGAMQAKGQDRYKVFVESLGQRLQKGRSFLDEIPEDVEKKPSQGAHDDGLEGIL